MLTAILVCSAIFCLLISVHRYRTRLLRATNNMYSISGQLPILGCAHSLVGSNKHLWEFIKVKCTEINEIQEKVGGLGTIWLGPTVLCIGVTDPDLCIEIANACLDKPYFYRWGGELFGQGLLTSNADVWKPHRKLLNPAFNQNVLFGFLQVFNQQSSKLVERLSVFAGLDEFPHRTYIAEASLENICQTAMGLPKTENSLSLISQTYRKNLDRVLKIYFERLRTLWKHPQTIYDFTSLKREESCCTKVILDITNDILKKSKESLQDDLNMNNKLDNEFDKQGPRFKPFFHLIVEESQRGQISDKEIRDEVNGIIAAGYDTTATSLAISLVMIGSHPEVQARIFQEIRETFGDSTRDVTKEDLPKLVYLEATVKETLRLYPVVPVIGRTTDKDVRIGKFTFPADSQLLLMIWGINRHPCWGADRNEFKPDRWLSLDTLPKNPNAFASFAVGKRICLGKIFALMSIKVMLVHFLRKYRVKADHTKLEFDFDFVIKPVAGDRISIELR